MSEGIGGVLVAPTEPSVLKRLGTSSYLPETYGVDFLWGTGEGLWGVQRKEIKDLVASMNDGRLGKEVVQMEGRLTAAVVVVEGRGSWSDDGVLLDGWTKVSRQQVRKYLYTVRSRGVWVEVSDGLQDTAEVVRGLVDWSRKEEHKALLTRPGPAGASWGKAGKREWAIHLLCGFEGIGSGMADRIIEHLGGVPLGWEVSEEELRQVAGIGKVRARKLIEALEATGEDTT